MSAQRNVELTWQKSADGPMWRLVADCGDERTYAVFAGRLPFDEFAVEDMLAGEFGAAMVAEHLARCAACGRAMSA